MNYVNSKIFEPNVIDTLLSSNDISESDLLHLISKFKLSKNGFCDIYFQKDFLSLGLSKRVLSKADPFQ